MHLSPLDPTQRPLADTTRFIAALNRNPVYHIGYCGTDPEDIAQALQSLALPLQQSFCVAYEQNQLIGVLGFDADVVLGRAWLYGPFVQHARWDGVADALYQAIMPLLPPAIRELELFCNVEHTLCQAFATRHQFASHSNDVILRFERQRLKDIVVVDTQQAQPRLTPQIQALHDRLFPHTYYSGQQMLDRLNEVRKVFVITEGASLQGYTYVEVEPELGEGRIEFVGVTEQARGKGIGSRLVRAALQWLFSFEQVQNIYLTTSLTNVDALRLYQHVGFVREHTMCGFRKKV